jgi:hypothetical protein
MHKRTVSELPGILENLSETTKYEDVLINFARLCIIYEFEVIGCRSTLNRSSRYRFNTDSNPDPDKTARHETISRICFSAFVQNEVHD